MGLDEAFVSLWTLLRWPTAILLLALVVAAVFRYAPVADLSFPSVLPGALVAVISWALASLALSFLLRVLPDYGAIYGGLGTAISLLLYLYFSAAVLLFGAEVNAELGHDTPKGGDNQAQDSKDPAGPGRSRFRRRSTRPRTGTNVDVTTWSSALGDHPWSRLTWVKMNVPTSRATPSRGRREHRATGGTLG